MAPSLNGKHAALSDMLWHSCIDILQQMLDIFDSTKKEDILKSSDQYSICKHEVISYKRLHIIPNLCAFPTEIISKIFEMAVWEEDWRKLAPQHAIRLSSIDRRCRDIAINTPRIWTTIFQSTRPEIMDIFIERSFPMNLEVYFDSEVEGHQEKLYSQTKGHLHRIGTFHVVGEWAWKETLELYSGTIFPNLSRLIIYRSCCTIFDSAPFESLAMPNLKCYEGPIFNPGIDPPWTKSLTHCSFVVHSGFRHYNRVFILPSCESLRLILNNLNQNISIESYLPNLRHLELELPNDLRRYLDYYRDDMFLFLKKLIPTRQLLSLKITLDSYIPEWLDIKQLILSRLPFDNLRSLQIYYTRSKLLDSPCSVETMPVLEHLEIGKLTRRRTSTLR